MFKNIYFFGLKVSDFTKFLLYLHTISYKIMGGIGSGGAREGAGRKAVEGTRVKISARVPEWIVNRIKSDAERQQISTSQLIINLLKKGLER